MTLTDRTKTALINKNTMCLMCRDRQNIHCMHAKGYVTNARKLQLCHKYGNTPLPRDIKTGVSHKHWKNVLDLKVKQMFQKYMQNVEFVTVKGYLKYGNKKYKVSVGQKWAFILPVMCTHTSMHAHAQPHIHSFLNES